MRNDQVKMIDLTQVWFIENHIMDKYEIKQGDIS